MKSLLGGASFPDWRLLYRNAGDSLAGTADVWGGFGTPPTFSTDGESISVVGSNNQYAALLLFTGLRFDLLHMACDLYVTAAGAFPSTFGLGLSSTDTGVAPGDNAYLDIVFGTGGVLRGPSNVLSSAAVPEETWFHVDIGYAGGRLNVWIDGTLFLSTAPIYSPSYITGNYNSVRIAGTARPTKAPKIKNIKVWVSDLGGLP